MKNLDPRTLLLLFTQNFFGTIYIIPVWYIGIFILQQLWVNNLGRLSKELVILAMDVAGLIFFFLLSLGCYYWGWLTFSNFTYELAPDGLHIRRGVFFKKHIHIPYQDIVNVELLINPMVFRVFQLNTLRIQSRELLNTEEILRKEHDERIVGLATDEASFIRAELLKLSHVNVQKGFSAPIA